MLMYCRDSEVPERGLHLAAPPAAAAGAGGGPALPRQIRRSLPFLPGTLLLHFDLHCALTGSSIQLVFHSVYNLILRDLVLHVHLCGLYRGDARGWLDPDPLSSLGPKLLN